MSRQSKRRTARRISKRKRAKLRSAKYALRARDGLATERVGRHHPRDGHEIDVFLSYNSRDEPPVRKLAAELEARGLRAWLDKVDLLPGDPWQEKLDAALGRARAIAVVIGSQGFGPWHGAELAVALSEGRHRRARVIPVLLRGAPAEIDLPRFLNLFTCCDFRKGFDPVTLEKLARGIRGENDDTNLGVCELKPRSSPWSRGGRSANERIFSILRLVETMLVIGTYAWIAWNYGRFP